VKQPCERTLVVGVLVNIGNAQFRLPEKRVIGTLEDLPLFGNRSDNGLQRRSSVRIAKGACVNFLDDGADPAPDGSEILEAFRPEEPGLIGAVGSDFQRSMRVRVVSVMASLFCRAVYHRGPGILCAKTIASELDLPMAGRIMVYRVSVVGSWLG
jgi:hypothetical protein